MCTCIALVSVSNSDEEELNIDVDKLWDELNRSVIIYAILSVTFAAMY